MDNGQLDGLLALKLVAEKRNFAAAATALGVSPSAISQIIKQLESRVGIALLTRTTRSTSLTEAGEKFLNQAGPAIEQILTALEDVGTYAQKPSGLLRINLPRSIYPTFLEPAIASFMKKYPEVSVELFFEDGQTDVVEKGFDAGIRLSDILVKDMAAVKLFGPVRFVTAASPKYLNKWGRPKHPKELLSHNCIRSRLGESLYDRWEFESKGSEFQVNVKGQLILNDSAVSLRAAMDGQGIVYTFEDAIKDKVDSGKLEIILANYSATSAGFYLYYPARSQVLPKLRCFIDHLKTSKLSW
jgi:DNA-binding transcriptional LysR family regulator